MMLENGNSLFLPQKQATHRLNATTNGGCTPDSKSFTVVFSGTTQELKEHLKKRFDEKLIAQLRPEIVFMDEDTKRMTHTITVSRLQFREKSFSFSICCSSRTASEVMAAVQQDIAGGQE